MFNITVYIKKLNKAKTRETQLSQRWAHRRARVIDDHDLEYRRYRDTVPQAIHALRMNGSLTDIIFFYKVLKHDTQHQL